MLFAQGLSVQFNTALGAIYAVRDVSLQIQKGETVGLVGESGCGKSVTAYSLMRLLPPNCSFKGSIFFHDAPVHAFNKKQLQDFRGKKISIIFQEPSRSFDPIASIGKTLQETLLAHHPEWKKDKKLLKEKCINLLQEVNIPNPHERLKNFPHQLSGGMLQRIMIAAALACDPEILIADEPTTALDVTIQRQITDLLAALKQKRSLSVLFITHDLHLVESIADRIIVMYNGIVMEEGRTAEVIAQPRCPYTQALLESVPQFGTHYSVNTLRSIPGSVPSPANNLSGCPFYDRCSKAIAVCKTNLPQLHPLPHPYRCVFTGEQA